MPFLPLEAVLATAAVLDCASQRSPKTQPPSLPPNEKEGRGFFTAAALLDKTPCPRDARAAVAGMPLVSQRPATAQGIIFITLEDETGTSNLDVHHKTN